MKNLPGNRKRLYYTSGLLSLILLPALCIWHIYGRLKAETQNALEVTWWNDNVFNRENGYSDDMLSKNKFLKINLTGNDKQNEITLDKAQLEIRELINSKDTTKGIYFSFDNHVKYKTYIKAIDLCKIEKSVFFVMKEQNLWVLNYIPKPVIKKQIVTNLEMCGTMYYDTCFKNVNDETEVERPNYILETIKKYYVSLVVFLLLTFLGIKNVYKETVRFRRALNVLKMHSKKYIHFPTP